MGGQPIDVQRIGQLAYVETGKLFLQFEASNDPGATTHSAALTAFVRKVEAIVDEMLERAGTSEGEESYLCVRSIEIHGRPWRSAVAERETQGDYWRILLLITTGL
jgi:hypothetical protein